MFVLTSAQGARAAFPPLAGPEAGGDAARLLEAARLPTCVCEEQRLELTRHRDAIAAAATVEEAREEALRPSRLARRALAIARWIGRDPSRLDDTRERLLAYEARAAKATTPADAPAELDGLVSVAGDVHVGTGGGCTYDATELIAIILGLFLFIIFC